MKYRLVGPTVAVLQKKLPTETASGLKLTGNENKVSDNEGTIISVSPMFLRETGRHESIDVSPQEALELQGAHVIFQDWGGSIVSMDGRDVLIIPWSCVLAYAPRDNPNNGQKGTETPKVS